MGAEENKKQEISLEQVCELLQAKTVCGSSYLSETIKHVFASDLMSDVLTLKTSEILLLTGLCNIQTIRTAEMSDVRAILFVRGKKVTADMIELAEENNMILMECPYSMYRAAGILWEAGAPAIY